MTPLSYLPTLPRRRDWRIGCVGAGFIMRDCHLVAYRQAGFNPVAIVTRRIEQAREVWLAADASKFNRPAMVEAATLSQIDRLFTDATPPVPFAQLLEEADVRLHVCLN